ncbi:MAG: ATP-binding cassette domain-containing protein [Novosphingobium sp.]
MSKPKTALDVLKPVLPHGKLALLLLVATAASLSEGLGLLLLVPMIELAGGQAQGTMAMWAGSLGIPRRLDLLLGLFVVLIALRSALVQWRILLEAQTRLIVTDALRGRLFRALLNADWRYLSAMRQGDLLALTTGSVDRAGASLQLLLGLLATLVTLTAMLAAAMLIALMPALSVALGGALVLALYAGLRRRAAQEGEVLGKRYKGFYGFFVERFDALRVVKSLGNEQREAERADAIADDLAKAQLHYQSGMALGQIALQTGAALALALAVWFALTRWAVPISALLPLVALFARSVPLLAAVQLTWQNYAHNASALLDIDAAITGAGQHAEPERHGASPAPGLTKDIRLDGVSVVFDGRSAPSLDAVSLAIAAGSVCFVTGPSGSGKSTLADLLAGLTRPDRGRVSIDGQALEGGTWAAWRERVAYVQQEPVLFDASIRDNLLWAAPEADEAQLRACLKRGAADFVLDLPQGLDTRVGVSGRQLSGGERQRIVLARALLRDPSLLILDEATSALDKDNEARIADAVAALRGSVTIVIIGHGGLLARLADQTVRLENGCIFG